MVILIHATTIFTVWRYAITIHLFGDMSLQLILCLRCVILYVFNSLEPTCTLCYFRMDKNTLVPPPICTHYLMGPTCQYLLLSFPILSFLCRPSSCRRVAPASHRGRPGCWIRRFLLTTSWSHAGAATPSRSFAAYRRAGSPATAELHRPPPRGLPGPSRSSTARRPEVAPRTAARAGPEVVRPRNPPDRRPEVEDEPLLVKSMLDSVGFGTGEDRVAARGCGVRVGGEPLADARPRPLLHPHARGRRGSDGDPSQRPSRPSSFVPCCRRHHHDDDDPSAPHPVWRGDEPSTSRRGEV
ncbi:unnamed protein product [Urochloa humidicola]